MKSKRNNLIDCHVCNKEIAKFGQKCPHCGTYTLQMINSAGKVFKVFSTIIIIVFGGLSFLMLAF